MGRRGFDDETPLVRQDEVLDDDLRWEFARAFPERSDSARVLHELSPTLVRARRAHQAKQLVLGVAASVLLVGGLGLAVNQMSGPAEGRLTFAGDPEPENDDGQPLEVTGTTSGQPAVPEADQTALADDDTAGGDSIGDDVGGSDPGPTTIPQAADGSPASPSTMIGSSTSRPRTPRATPTTGTGSTSTTEVDSRCGSVVVVVSGSAIGIVESLPVSGFSADEKSSGPEKIEVGFEGRRGHCELKITMQNGTIQVERDD